MELEQCIKDALEESMQGYNLSDENVQRRQEISLLINDLRRSLREDQSAKLNQILDAISTQDGLFASEAYMHGVMEGITLHNKYIAK